MQKTKNNVTSRRDLTSKRAPKSAEIHLVIYKTSSGVVISHNCYTIYLTRITSFIITNCPSISKVRVLDTLITVLLNTSTQLVLDTCRVTQYLG